MCLSPAPGRPSCPRGCGVSDGHTVSSGHRGFWLQQRRSHPLELQYFKWAFVYESPLSAFRLVIRKPPGLQGNLTLKSPRPPQCPSCVS